MKARIVDLMIKPAAVAGLAAGLALGGGFDAGEAQRSDSAEATGDAGNARAAACNSAATEETESEWDVPPMPGLPGRPY